MASETVPLFFPQYFTARLITLLCRRPLRIVEPEPLPPPYPLFEAIPFPVSIFQPFLRRTRLHPYGRACQYAYNRAEASQIFYPIACHFFFGNVL